MILTGNLDEIRNLIILLKKEVKMLITEAIELSYFSRGSISYTDILNMSPEEREMVRDFLENRLKQAQKMPIPIF